MAGHVPTIPPPPVASAACDGGGMTARWTACLVLVGCASAGAPSTPGVDAATDGKTVDAPGVVVDAPPSPCDLMLAGHATGFESGVGGWTHAVMDGASA